ncbi:hypothetical protein BD779DRAFT_1472625 [Infundibulicybe gibba]|nr:hypothetical protein BD779DRAFT_1472625 [Infundibulicybe gibba]
MSQHSVPNFYIQHLAPNNANQSTPPILTRLSPPYSVARRLRPSARIHRGNQSITNILHHPFQVFYNQHYDSSKKSPGTGFLQGDLILLYQAVGLAATPSLWLSLYRSINDIEDAGIVFKRRAKEMVPHSAPPSFGHGLLSAEGESHHKGSSASTHAEIRGTPSSTQIRAAIFRCAVSTSLTDPHQSQDEPWLRSTTHPDLPNVIKCRPDSVVIAGFGHDSSSTSQNEVLKRLRVIMNMINDSIGRPIALGFGASIK